MAEFWTRSNTIRRVCALRLRACIKPVERDSASSDIRHRPREPVLLRRMGSWTLTFCLLLTVCYVTQSLKCYWCRDIREKANCSQAEEMECSPSHTHCLRMELHLPAYGLIQRCATLKECVSIADNSTEDLVDVRCCDTHLCN